MVSRPLTRERIAVLAAIAVVALAAATLITRLPTTLHGLSGTRMHNDTYDAFGRSAAAAADSLGIDNGFVAESVATLPPNASYAVLMPPRSVIGEGKLSEITYDAVPPFMRETLLPRREVDAGSAGYILCYECGQRVRGVQWVWTNDAGDRIGVRR